MISLEKLDRYLLVVDSGRTTQTQVKDVLDLLRPTPCLGTILNRYQGRFGDPYGYGYGGNAYTAYYS